MDKVLTLIIGTQIQMEFGKVLIIRGVLFFEDLYIFRGISTLKKLSFVGGPLWRFLNSLGEFLFLWRRL